MFKPEVRVSGDTVDIPGIGLVYWDTKEIFISNSQRFAELFPPKTESLNISKLKNCSVTTSLTYALTAKVEDVTFETYMSEVEVEYFYGKEAINGTADSGIRDTELHQPQENSGKTC